MVENESIIEVIQKMVQEGSSREKILQTLHDLGVNEEQSKRLLLIAEADTFTLLKREIASLVKSEFVEQKTGFVDLIKKDFERAEQEEKLKVTEIATASLRDVKEDIVSESRNFEGRINKVIGDSQKTVSLVKVALDSLNNRLSQMELDVEQMKVHKFRKRTIIFSYLMLALGTGLLLLVVFLFLSGLNSLDPAQIIMLAILSLASITLMFASIIG
jgi:hypothetical protein